MIKTTSCIIFFVLSSFLFKGYCQSQDQNYIKSVQFLEPVDINTVNSSYGTIEKIENVTYLDGLGKTKQSIAIKQSPTLKDIVQHLEYDEFGRTSKQYLTLPTTQNTGNYVTNALSQITTYYQTNFNDQHPFAEVRYDNTPLSRKLESSTPGNTWELLIASEADHTTKYDYGYNTQNEVYKFDIVNQPNKTFQITNYPEGELLKNIVKNENWVASDGLLNTKEVFTDKSGKKIAEFSYEEDVSNIKKLRTYYVYDNVGNLRYVIPPKGLENLYGNYTHTPFDLTFNWTLFVDNPATVTGSGDVNIELLFNTSVNDYQLISDFNLSFPKTFGGSQGAYLKQGNVVALPINVDMPKKYLFSVYPTKKTDPGDPIDPIDPDGGGNPAKSRYEYSIQNGYLFVEFLVGTEFGSPTSPFMVNVVDVIYGSILGESYNESAVGDLCFQYKYDAFNRQIEQKVPGKDWEYMVYDPLDRPILTQDANLRTQNKWLFVKYDAFGRVVYTGTYTDTGTRAYIQTQVDGYTSVANNSNIEARVPAAASIGGVSINYSNNAYPRNNIEVLTVNYYDDYNFTDSNLPTIPTTVLGQTVTTQTKGLLTSTWTKTLDQSSWSKNYSFYDIKGQLIYLYDKNYLGGYTKNESQLDFRGKVEESITKHKRTSSVSELTITDYFEYDHVERPKKHYQKINTQVQELISENSYNELGQLTSKKVGGGLNNVNPLQTVNYTYNIRGWLTNVNDVNNLGLDLFAYNIKYNESIEGTALSDAQYNGNIRQVIWKSAYDNTKRGYVYKYDKLNRFNGAYYREGSSLTSGAGKFETTDIGYDTNGNIEALKRKNQLGQLMDDLSYNYDSGNKLFSIDDATNNNTGFNDGSSSSTEYDYDLNGNLIKDLNKTITAIEYNHLDLVKKVTFNNGNRIEFTYDANGSKLEMKTVVSGGATTSIDYLGGFQYTGTQLQFFPTPEGYASKNGTTYSYVYLYRDHLGNNRLSYSDTDNSGIISPTEIQSNTNYYAMGMIHTGEYVANSNYNYKYQDKEQLAFNGYNMYDFGSRMYDASVGRWFNTDPQNQFGSPYVAMGNLWVIGVDPNGELFGLDDLVAGLVTGIINVASQAISGNIDSWGDGFAYFGVGFVAGLTATYTGGVGTAAILSAGNSAYGQYDKYGSVSTYALAQDTFLGAVTAGVAGPLANKIGDQFTGVFSNVKNSLLKEVLTNSATQSTTGFAFGTGFSLLSGKSLDESLKDGAKGAANGFVSGVATGFGNHIRYKNKQARAELLKRDQVELEKQVQSTKIPAENKRYAFGFKEEALKLAEKIDGNHLMKDADFKSSFKKIINDKNSEIHFSLDGGFKESNLQQVISRPTASSTNWELNMLYNSPAFERTVFHFQNNIYMGFEAFKLKL